MYLPLAELAPDFVFVINRDMTVRFVNPFAARHLKLAPDRIVGQDLERLFTPAVAARFKQNLARVMDSAQNYQTEGPILTSGGEQCWAVTHLIPLKNGNGEVDAVLGISRDISARKKREEELQEAEERYRRLVSLSPDGIAVFTEGKLLFANAAAAKIVGADDPDQILGRPATDFLPEGQAEHVRQRVADIFGEGRSVAMEELRCRRLDGSERMIEARGTVIVYRGKISVLVVFRDISERISTENTLRVTQCAVENAGDAIFWVGRDGAIQYANAQAARMLDRPRHELLALTVVEVCPQFQKENWTFYWEKVRFSSKALAIGTRLTTRSGQPINVELTLSFVSFRDQEFILAFARDTTERLRAEEQLRASQRLFATAFHNSPNYMSISRLADGRFIDINEAFVRAVGLPREEILGRTSVELGVLAPRDRELLKETLLRDGKMMNQEIPFWNARKEMRYALVSASLVLIEDEQCLVIEAVDITERRNVEQTLRRSEERFRCLAENARDLIFRLNLVEERYEYVSPSCTAMTGYTPEEHYNEPLMVKRLMHPDSRPMFEEAWSRLFAGEVPPSFEFKIIRRDGEVRWFNQRNTLVRDKSGKAIALEGAVTDVTERKRAEDEIRLRQEMYRFLLDRTGRVVFLYRHGPVGEKAGPFVEVSPAAERLTGYTRDELLAMSLWDIVPGENHARMAELQRQLEEKTEMSFEMEIRSREGKTLPLAVTLRRINYQGDECVVGIADQTA